MISEFFQALGDLVFPRVCCVCGRQLLFGERDICIVCRADLPETGFSPVRRNPMADMFNKAVEQHRGDEFEAYSCAASLFYYEEDSGYSNITKELKYHRNFSVGRTFALLLGRRLSDSELFRDVDAVVPVPLHWARHWSRGYNQAEIIARAVAKELQGRPGVEHLLKRHRRTASQTRLQGDAKAENVKDAFSWHGGKEVPPFRHILLTDDVFTSGSTMAECHRVLREKLGPEVKISAATLAFVKR